MSKVYSAPPSALWFRASATRSVELSRTAAKPVYPATAWSRGFVAGNEPFACETACAWDTLDCAGIGA
ncbi:hypothetical protein RRF57_006288 [Xylaria bambusicola]|uniref:Uncharacterized protein n=1 Tax=Xylaria bambusicola TaxID=326684 RepID=A0AAN7UQ52_9PEZI